MKGTRQQREVGSISLAYLVTVQIPIAIDIARLFENESVGRLVSRTKGITTPRVANTTQLIVFSVRFPILFFLFYNISHHDSSRTMILF